MPITRRPARAGLAAVPLHEEVPSRRARVRRGGPRTPLRLIPLIALLAGVGVAYVSQSAHTTQASYQLGALSQQNEALRARDMQLGSDLARLESTERIVAAAQKMGMRPAGRWSYVDVRVTPVIRVASAGDGTVSPPPADPLAQILDGLAAALGVRGAGGAR